MHANAFHKVWITHGVKVVAPLEGCVIGRDDGIFPALIYTIALDGRVRLFNQRFVICLKPGQPLFKVHI